MRKRKAVQSVDEAHTSWITGLGFASSERLVSCGLDGRARLWRLTGTKAEAAQAFTCGAPATGLAVRPNGRLLGVATTSGVRMWNLDTMRPR